MRKIGEGIVMQFLSSDSGRGTVRKKSVQSVFSHREGMPIVPPDSGGQLSDTSGGAGVVD